MAEIFLTGATGFVGRHLVPELINAGHQVGCLVRSDERAGQLRELGCKIVLGDLLHAQSSSLDGIEVVIHLASLHKGSPVLIRRTNADGTAQLLQIAQEIEVQKFLYLSTLTASDNPAWPYAHSTWLAEQAIQQSSLDYTILRCSIILGPGEPFVGGILQMAQRWPVVPMIGSGQTKFQPVSVYDIARCVLKVIADNTYTNRTLTVGGPEILSYEQIVNAVLDVVHMKKRKIHLPRRATRFLVRWLEHRDIETPFAPGYFLSRDHIAASPTVIEEEFGFTPQSFGELLADIVRTPVADH
jgi:NADH dehydrogenase